MLSTSLTCRFCNSMNTWETRWQMIVRCLLVHNFCRAWLTHWRMHARTKCSSRSTLNSFLNFIWRHNDGWLNFRRSKFSEENLDPGNRTTWEVLKTYHVVEPWVGPRITLNWTKHTAWGPHISRHMLDWMQKFRWPSDDSQDEVASIGVSWYELVLSFMKTCWTVFSLA